MCPFWRAAPLITQIDTDIHIFVRILILILILIHIHKCGTVASYRPDRSLHNVRTTACFMKYRERNLQNTKNNTGKKKEECSSPFCVHVHV